MKRRLQCLVLTTADRKGVITYTAKVYMGGAFFCQDDGTTQAEAIAKTHALYRRGLKQLLTRWENQRIAALEVLADGFQKLTTKFTT